MNVLEVSVSDEIRAQAHPRLSSLREVKRSWIALLQLLVVVAISLSGTAQITPTQHAPEPDDLEQFIPAQMRSWNVPGLAIAVVQNGPLTYSHGFGLRDAKGNLPVTSKAIFAIGSISKYFHSLSMGMLNDEGKLDWDKPVRQYLPEFQMYDPVASERMTPRDLISHRVGMAGHDLLWYSSDFSREDLVRRLPFLQSDHDFRSGYHYNNLLVMTAGYLVGKVSGQSWEGFVRHRVFEPLQMNSSNFSVLDSQKSSDFAHPYRKDEHSGAISEIAFHAMSAIGPAGSINSYGRGIARYEVLRVGKRKRGDRQVVSGEKRSTYQTPQVGMSGGVQ